MCISKAGFVDRVMQHFPANILSFSISYSQSPSRVKDYFIRDRLANSIRYIDNLFLQLYVKTVLLMIRALPFKNRDY